VKRKRKVKYERALVTYLDILGFRDLIESRSAGEISRILGLVKREIKPDSEIARLYKLKYQSFSDLTVISTPIDTVLNRRAHNGPLFSEVFGLIHAQVILVDEGILLRGAITIGDIVRSYGLLYGPAMVKAYDLERKVAKYPRIVIDEQVLRELRRNPLLRRWDYKTEKEYLDEMLECDDAGVTFLDYLKALASELEYLEDYAQFLKRHKKLVEDGLKKYAHEKEVVKKYQWLKHYHNTAVRGYIAGPASRKLLV